MDWKYFLRSPTDFQNTCFQYVANYSSVFKLLTAFENRMKHVLSCLICYDNSLRQLILKAFCKPSYAVSTWIVRNKLEPWTLNLKNSFLLTNRIQYYFRVCYFLYPLFFLHPFSCFYRLLAFLWSVRSLSGKRWGSCLCLQSWFPRRRI